MISFAIIIYQNCINNVFEKELKKQRYEGIEEIRYRNYVLNSLDTLNYNITILNNNILKLMICKILWLKVLLL